MGTDHVTESCIEDYVAVACWFVCSTPVSLPAWRTPSFTAGKYYMYLTISAFSLLTFNLLLLVHAFVNTHPPLLISLLSSVVMYHIKSKIDASVQCLGRRGLERHESRAYMYQILSGRRWYTWILTWISCCWVTLNNYFKRKSIFCTEIGIYHMKSYYVTTIV